MLEDDSLGEMEEAYRTHVKACLACYKFHYEVFENITTDNPNFVMSILCTRNPCERGTWFAQQVRELSE